ncbi:MAG: metallophosphoesterase family protein [Myxococcota bacterium]
MPKTRSLKARRPWSHRSTEVVGRHDDRIRIAVISDTHSQPHPKSPDLVADLEPDAIFHAGDVGSLEALRPFESIAPIVVVRGNIDTRADELPDSVDIRMSTADGQNLPVVLLRHICVYGPKLRADAAKEAQSHGASIVVCGHSHVPFIGRDRGLLVFNPGSIGPRRFTLPIVFGVLELSAKTVSLYHLSCETGQRWTPHAA